MRYVTLTLNNGLGASLGPNFTLTSNYGSVTPASATRTELLSGKTVQVDDGATTVSITSLGTCTNSLTLAISGLPSTTTTSTTSTTTTTTTAGATQTYSFGYDSIAYYTACSAIGTDYYSTSAVLGYGDVLYDDYALTTPSANGYYSDGVNWWRIRFGSGIITSTGVCGGTTTTTSTTSTTTSAYDYYLADEYVCLYPGCSLNNTNVVVALPGGTSYVGSYFYPDSYGSGFVYKITNSTSIGIAVILQPSGFSACTNACSI
jgi:hypothetical protein